MATIDKISAILNTEIKMPFKIKARESVHTGNPFKDSSFDRLTLPADIFESTELKSQNRTKMIMSAIAGSVSSFTQRIVEPISAFCSKVKENLSTAWDKTTSAWNYAKTTSVTEFGQAIGHSISEKAHSVGSSISERISSLKKRAEINKINENTPVLELESMWIQENSMMEVAA